MGPRRSSKGTVSRCDEQEGGEESAGEDDDSQQGAQLAERYASDEHHQEDDAAQDECRREVVGGNEQEGGDGATEYPLEGGAGGTLLFLEMREDDGDRNDESHLCQLGGLERHAEDFEPAYAIVLFHTQSALHQDEANPRKEQQQRGELEHTQGDELHADSQGRTANKESGVADNL